MLPPPLPDETLNQRRVKFLCCLVLLLPIVPTHLHLLYSIFTSPWLINAQQYGAALSLV